MLEQKHEPFPPTVERETKKCPSPNNLEFQTLLQSPRHSNGNELTSMDPVKVHVGDTGHLCVRLRTMGKRQAKGAY